MARLASSGGTSQRFVDFEGASIVETLKRVSTTSLSAKLTGRERWN